MSEQKERPIIFNGEMVRAILEGRKTQTRRIIKNVRQWCGDDCIGMPKAGNPLTDNFPIPLNSGFAEKICRYGKVGDLLWVKETWQPNPEAGMTYPEGKISSDSVCYAADLSKYDYDESRPWKPSIHMPKWAARIWLEITDIRVERVQEIKEEDCNCEGCPWPADSDLKHRIWFETFWNSLNEKSGFGWKENPWVWVIEFKRKK